MDETPGPKPGQPVPPIPVVALQEVSGQRILGENHAHPVWLHFFPALNGRHWGALESLNPHWPTLQDQRLELQVVFPGSRFKAMSRLAKSMSPHTVLVDEDRRAFKRYGLWRPPLLPLLPPRLAEGSFLLNGNGELMKAWAGLPGVEEVLAAL